MMNQQNCRGTTALSEPILKASATPTIKADAYFFDIDGTLMISRDLVHWHAMHQAMLEVYGLDANFDGIPYHGKTDVAILRMALTRRGISIPPSLRSCRPRWGSFAEKCPPMWLDSNQMCAHRCPSY